MTGINAWLWGILHHLNWWWWGLNAFAALISLVIMALLAAPHRSASQPARLEIGLYERNGLTRYEFAVRGAASAAAPDAVRALAWSADSGVLAAVVAASRDAVLVERVRRVVARLVGETLEQFRIHRSRTGLYCLPVNKDVAQCQFDGCGQPLEKYRSVDYCREHAGAAFPCLLAREGCRGRVAAWSRSRVCARHASGLRRGMAP